jgi:hypothetical protein
MTRLMGLQFKVVYR